MNKQARKVINIRRSRSQYIKNQILEILNNSQTSPFLFIGTGLSIRYLKTLNWEDLLRLFAEQINKSELAFEMYKENAKQIVENEKNKLFPEIASLIEKDFNRNWFTDKEFEKNRKKYSSQIKDGLSPFKIEVTEFFCNKKINKEIEDNLSREIDLLKKVGEKNISGIITTNYDTLLEQILPDYKIYIGQQELIFSTIQGIGEIYKIHGCCSNPNSIIINSEDYETFGERNAYLSAKLLTIFLEHPIIFVGYSLNDDDINKILKSIIKCLTQDQLSELKKRMIFIEWNNTKGPDTISTHSKTFEDGKILELTRVFLKDFTKLYLALLENKAKSRYSITTLRKLKEDIYDLVISNDPKGKIKVISPMNSENEEEIFDFVVGVGVSKEFGIKGLISITNEDVYKDILFDTLCSNPEFNLNIFVEKTLPDLLSRYTNSVPLYKYIKLYNNNEGLPEKIKSQIKENYIDFLNRTLRNNPINLTIDEIKNNYNLIECLKYIPRITNEDNISKESLYEYLKDLFKNNPDILNKNNENGFQKTSVRRLIKIYDWLENYKDD